MTYNLDDWTQGGWAHFLEGYTIFLSSADDLAFSPSNGLLVADISRGVPMVSIREQRKIMRGPPYSSCYNEKNEQIILDFYPVITHVTTRYLLMFRIIQKMSSRVYDKSGHI